MRYRHGFLYITLVAIALINPLIPINLISKPAIAQSRLRPRDIWRLVYQQVPDIPLENHYISKLDGEPRPDNTLVLRIIRYHMFVKTRTPQYRLDWKLTLADYMGANELMYERVYPSGEVLVENPLEGDRQAVRNMTRSQRNALVDALVNAYISPTQRD
ncbi:hypothetical protein [Roseofilum casamattae]|uniref:Uncharacterized protein n=1 Tax=Roseofilum casamattae BLCC-M143 TaxID=3022442 RepID=A0ABT7C391_9CYAN|nr:hypothetical protein [Roseofilum casamattae]MDJ1185890.1 hypothetical protein [Roseofilum casamattae BLCC-M143]